MFKVISFILFFFVTASQASLQDAEVLDQALCCAPQSVVGVEKNTIKAARKRLEKAMDDHKAPLSQQVLAFAGYYNSLHVLLDIYQAEAKRESRVRRYQDKITGLIDMVWRDGAYTLDSQPIPYFRYGVRYVILNPENKEKYLSDLKDFKYKWFLNGDSVENVRSAIEKASLLPYRGDSLEYCLSPR